MDGQYLPMKSWAEDERPREKMIQKGVSTLSMNELFAILLRSGVDGESALEVARRILADHHNDLNELARCGVRELVNKYKGVGIAKAASIVAAMEISRRRKPEVAAKAVVRCSKDVYYYINSFMADLEHEEFWVIYLGHANQIKGCECMSSGGMDSTVIDVRMLFRSAIDRKATNIIITHNHPGGNLTPSSYDEMITRKILEGGKLLDINLFDHIIIGGDAYFSFADEGLLKFVNKR